MGGGAVVKAVKDAPVKNASFFTLNYGVNMHNDF